MFVSGKLRAQRIQKQLIINFTDHVARLVQLSHDSGMWSLHEITDDLVVEVIHLPTNISPYKTVAEKEE